MEPLNKVSRILSEQDADPVPLRFKKECLDYPPTNKSQQKILEKLTSVQTKVDHHHQS